MCVHSSVFQVSHIFMIFAIANMQARVVELYICKSCEMPYDVRTVKLRWHLIAVVLIRSPGSLPTLCPWLLGRNVFVMQLCLLIG